MSAPQGWIFAGSVPLCFRSVEDALDPAPHPRGRFRLREPDRLQHGQDIRRGDLVDRLATQRRGVFAEGHFPLAHVLRIPKLGLHRFDIGVGLITEIRDGRRCGQLRFNGIDAGLQVCTSSRGKLTGASERNRVQATLSHFPQPVIAAIEEDPALTAGLVDGQVKPAAIAVPAGFGNRNDRSRVQFVQQQSHIRPNIYPNNCPSQYQTLMDQPIRARQISG